MTDIVPFMGNSFLTIMQGRARLVLTREGKYEVYLNPRYVQLSQHKIKMSGGGCADTQCQPCQPSFSELETCMKVPQSSFIL